MDLDDYLATMPKELQQGLRWFKENAGKLVPWTTQLGDGTRLFCTPKGIYKPAGSEYALSVRQTLNSPYHDRVPVRRSDGTWTYMYFQEGDSPSGDDLYTNRALKRCMERGILVGVARQKTAKPNPTSYEILGVAKVAQWKDGFFQLEGYSSNGVVLSQPIDGPYTEELVRHESHENTKLFDPTNQADARERQLCEIVRRRGQRAFRARLLPIYGGRCAITGCEVEVILEAAHITPYLGPETNEIGNGMLLRADIHTLWDLALIAINPKTLDIWLSPRLMGSEYECLNGTKPTLPANAEHCPSMEALTAQWQLATCNAIRTVSE